VKFAWGTYDTENSIIDGYTRNPYQKEIGRRPASDPRRCPWRKMYDVVIDT